MKVRWFLCQFVIVISTFAFGVMFGTGEIRSDNPGEKANDDCPMGGCSWSRNPVNTRDKNMPTEWSTEEGQRKNIKWVARLGKVTYGGPLIAGIVGAVSEAATELHDVHISEPSLENLFLHHTGRSLRQ